MEILFVSHKFPPAVGGMEKQSFELISGMRQYTRVHTLVYSGEGSRLGFFLSLDKRIKQLCKENPGISVIHFNDGLLATVCLWHKGPAQLLRSVTVHGLDVVFPNKIYQKYILPAFNRFHSVIAVSRATADACIQRGIAKEKVAVINNGVDVQLAGRKRNKDFLQHLSSKLNVNFTGKKVMVTMGRPVKRKGFSWFIRHVLPELKGDFILLMIGPLNTAPKKQSFYSRILPQWLKRQAGLFLASATDEEEIKELLQLPSLNRKVKHLGRLSTDEILNILTAADAFIMPNIEVEGDMEGFGLVCLEAALCGAVVFASDTGGIRDAVIDNENGILLPTGDRTAWAARLNNFLANPGEYLAMSEKFRQYSATRFGWDKMVKEYHQHFQSLRTKN